MGTRLRVLTFNMQYGQPWDAATPDTAPIKMEDTIRFIKEHAADIIFLQEVERVEPTNGQVEPPPNFTMLREALDGYHAYFSYPKADPEELPFGYGLAIFAKWPLENPRTVELPAADISFDFFGVEKSPTARLMICVECAIAGVRVNLCNTHLQAYFMIEGSSDRYPQQRETVGAELAKMDGPTLLAGDMNAAPFESTVNYFEALGFETAQDSVITWRRRPFVLDHIFFNEQFELETVNVIDNLISDHLPVEAVFTLET